MNPSRPPQARASLGLTLALLASALLAACGDAPTDSRKPVSEVREADAMERAMPPQMDTAQRLGMRSAAATPGAAAGASPAVPAPGGLPALTWSDPAGWTPQPATAMRVANFTLADSPESECYLTVLPGEAGGMLANLNRWRQQMSLEPMAAEDLDLLPRIPMLGGEALRVALDGTYVGMRGDQQSPGYRMLGAALMIDGHSYFVRLTGPVAAIAAQDANFDAFCASLQRGAAEAAPEDAHDHAEDDGHDHAAPPAPAAPAAPPAPAPAPAAAPAAPGRDLSQLQWDAPAHWTRGGERMMRLVTFTVGQSECYVTQLAGDGGGVEMNLNRWQGQMGQPDLDAAAIAALPRINILGVESPLIDIAGDFTNMDGSAQPGARMLGTVTLLDGQSLFVKMTGPDAEIAAERDHFIAFCQSLR
jgi:hypothetical protein